MKSCGTKVEGHYEAAKEDENIGLEHQNVHSLQLGCVEYHEQWVEYEQSGRDGRPPGEVISHGVYERPEAQKRHHWGFPRASGRAPPDKQCMGQPGVIRVMVGVVRLRDLQPEKIIYYVVGSSRRPCSHNAMLSESPAKGVTSGLTG